MTVSQVLIPLCNNNFITRKRLVASISAQSFTMAHARLKCAFPVMKRSYTNAAKHYLCNLCIHLNAQDACVQTQLYVP